MWRGDGCSTVRIVLSIIISEQGNYVLNFTWKIAVILDHSRNDVTFRLRKNSFLIRSTL